MVKKRKFAVVGKDCVACGCCVSGCPVKAISIHKGIRALVDRSCIGCGKCAKACPAGIITLVEKEAEAS